MTIEHIESLPPAKFIQVLENLSQYTITEKLDGVNLVFGFDENSNFYTSRETKGGTRFYNSTDYPVTAATNGFRSAHQALENVKVKLMNIMSAGDSIEVEMLFGRQPNAIVYGTNCLVLLRMLSGEEHKLDLITSLLKYTTTVTRTDTITTNDGVSLKKELIKPYVWDFAAVPVIDHKAFATINFLLLNSRISNLNKWLSEKSVLCLTNEQLLDVNLTKVKGTEERLVVKIARETARVKAAADKLKIKEQLIDGVLRNAEPALRNTAIQPHEDLGIEGIVLRHLQNGEQIKIVDKPNFSTINQFNHAIRNQIKLSGRTNMSFDGVHIDQENSIYNDMLTSITNTFGIEGNHSIMTIKRTLRKFQGDGLSDTITNIKNNITLINYNTESLQRYVIADIYLRLVQLSVALKTYNSEWNDYRYCINGKTIKYTDAVHNRTLTVFAEVRQEIEGMVKCVKSATSIDEVIVAVYEKTLNSIHHINK